MLYMLLSCSAISDTLQPPWTVACHAPLSMGFSRQEYWSGLPFPSPLLYIYINQWQIYLRVKTSWSWFWIFFNYGKYLPLTLAFKCHHLTHPSQDSALIEYRKPNLMTAILTVIYLLQRYSHRALRDVSIPLTNVFFAVLRVCQCL